MKNFILQNENAIYFECKFSCDNVIFLNLGDEKYFITDARYITEALEYAKKCQVIQSSNLIETTKEILKKNKIKK
ncbi:MAG: X-Pro aminopeptidase, partial [Aliarcobacter sp.]|nr:X-Pro aminopeptidase [Aliarcobacter sp.]